MGTGMLAQHPKVVHLPLSESTDRMCRALRSGTSLHGTHGHATVKAGGTDHGVCTLLSVPFRLGFKATWQVMAFFF